MKPKIFWVVTLLVMAGACSRTPDIFAPPTQRAPLTGPVAHLGPFVEMKDFIADAYIVQDVSKTVEGTGWRWTYRHPQLRFYLEETGNLKFMADFSLTPATFRDTGPVTLTFRINDRELDRVRFDQPGDRHFERAVAGAWLRARDDNIVAIESDKLWISPGDGVALMLVLHRAGFRPN